MSRNTPLRAPIACDLTALTSSERARRAILAKKVHEAVAGRRELVDGYALKVNEKKVSIAEIDDWIGLEGKCCPFLRFALIGDCGALWLHLTGGLGVRDFLNVEMGRLR